MGRGSQWYAIAMPTRRCPPTRPGPGTQRWDAWSWLLCAGLAAPQADRIRVRLPLPSTRKIWRRCGTSWAWSGGICGASQLAPSSPSPPPCAPQSRIHGLILAYMGASGRRITEDARSVLSPQHPPYRSLLAGLAGDASPRLPAVLGTIEPHLAAATWAPFGEQPFWRDNDRALVACPVGDARVWAVFEQFATDFEVQERLGEIRVPTLVVAGQQDPVIPPVHVERLAVGLPQAEFVMLEVSGHVDVNPGSADGEKVRF